MNEMQINRIIAHRVVTQAHRAHPSRDWHKTAVTAFVVAVFLTLLAALVVAVVALVKEIGAHRDAEQFADAANADLVAMCGGAR